MVACGCNGPSIRMSKETRWLLSEIERWTADEIISPEQADRLRSRYAAPADGPPWGLIVFASAGALVIGLGVVLLFAYNWRSEERRVGKECRSRWAACH